VVSGLDRVGLFLQAHGAQQGKRAQVTQLPANFSAKEKTKKWYTDLHTKPASYTISTEEERQMTYDMESSYNEFMNWLQRSGQVS